MAGKPLSPSWTEMLRRLATQELVEGGASDKHENAVAALARHYRRSRAYRGCEIFAQTEGFEPIALKIRGEKAYRVAASTRGAFKPDVVVIDPEKSAIVRVGEVETADGQLNLDQFRDYRELAPLDLMYVVDMGEDEGYQVASFERGLKLAWESPEVWKLVDSWWVAWASSDAQVEIGRIRRIDYRRPRTPIVYVRP